MSKKTKLRDKDWKEASKLSFEERYQRMVDSTGTRQYLKDTVTGEIHSRRRLAKKEIMETLLHPSSRQYRKEKRFLKWKNAQESSGKLAP